MPSTSAAGETLMLTCHSPADEESYPGNLTVTAVYTITDDHALHLNYTATTD